ncbi:MAG: penicillin-binding protein 2 [Propionibacteriaceae bacterium]|nr:penicillin-binding protein 2 [Propionibacteriaceae bacterium]
MNRPIRVLSLVVFVLFLALMANLTYAQVARQTVLNERPENRRVTDARFAQDRGPIMVGNIPIAQSVPVKDHFKFQREYPNPALYAPITGFYSYYYGSTGLEASQSPYLSGATDQQVLEQLIRAAAGQAPRGAKVETTISAKAQKAAWDGLAGRKGAVVALDYHTGAVKALVSSPSFDPSLLATHDLKASQAAWEQLNKAAEKPLANRATREIYAPGSTFKLITAAAALETGYAADSQIDSSRYRLPNSDKVITGSCGGSKVSLSHALQVSCNPGFARLGAELGAQTLQEQAEAFGFGKRWLPEIGSAASRFPTGIDAAQTAMSAIGEYEVAATPLQMAMVAAAIANDGVVMEPYLVNRILRDDLSVISEATPSQASIAVSSTTAAQLRQMMVGVVESGTGQRAKISGVEVGGKTGTAVTDRVRTPYAWFVAYAKEYGVAVAVFIEDANVSASEVAGGRVSAPVAKAVLEALK